MLQGEVLGDVQFIMDLQELLTIKVFELAAEPIALAENSGVIPWFPMRFLTCSCGRFGCTSVPWYSLTPGKKVLRCKRPRVYPHFFWLSAVIAGCAVFLSCLFGIFHREAFHRRDRGGKLARWKRKRDFFIRLAVVLAGIHHVQQRREPIVVDLTDPEEEGIVGDQNIVRGSEPVACCKHAGV